LTLGTAYVYFLASNGRPVANCHRFPSSNFERRLVTVEEMQTLWEEVLENLGKGIKPNLGKIARKKGYKQNTADNPKNITDTKSYKEVINPVVRAMEKERDAAIKMMSKVRNKAKYRDFADAIDKLTKNIQLLTGGKTENNGVEELAESINNWITNSK
jgi:hypothetical protein